MFPLEFITEGPRILLSSWKNRLAPRKFQGTAEDICRQIVKECWNGRYFQTSLTNFSQFWTRDFGWCTQSLLKLGYKEEVQHTLRYALNRFRHARKITATITPRGRPFDAPVPAVDSLPWLIHSIRIAKFPYHSFKPFLNHEIRKFYERFINPQTGLVKPELHVSSIKDYAVRKSSCYDNCMVALLAKDLGTMKLDNPFKKIEYPSLITRHLWNGTYFYDDLQQKHYVAGDANLFPFLLGIITDKEMLSSAITQIQAAGLDRPFPLRYTAGRRGVEFIPEELLMRDYESNTLWMHLGLLYVKMLQQVDKEKAGEHRQAYTSVIESHGNFLEVFTPDGKPFRTPFYYAASGMLWAANYLAL